MTNGDEIDKENCNKTFVMLSFPSFLSLSCFEGDEEVTVLFFFLNQPFQIHCFGFIMVASVGLLMFLLWVLGFFGADANFGFVSFHHWQKFQIPLDFSCFGQCALNTIP